jgi:hypothetical protein
MADSDQPPRFLNRQASTMGNGHFVFETTFRPEGEVLAKPLLPANAGDCDRAAHGAYSLNTPFAILGKRRIGPYSLTYQYSKYQSHAGMH